MPLLFDYWYSVISQPLYNMIFQWIGVSRFARGISLGGHFSSYHIDEVVWDKGLQQLAILCSRDTLHHEIYNKFYDTALVRYASQ